MEDLGSESRWRGNYTLDVYENLGIYIYKYMRVQTCVMRLHLLSLTMQRNI